MHRVSATPACSLRVAVWMASVASLAAADPAVTFSRYDLGVELEGTRTFDFDGDGLEEIAGIRDEESEEDADDVIIEFQNSRVADHSAIEAIDTLAERYIRAGKTIHLRHLSEECRQLLKKAGNLVEVNVMEDPRYHVADDQLA